MDLCEKCSDVSGRAVGSGRRSRPGNADRAALRRADKYHAGRVGLRPRMDSRTLRTLSSHALWLWRRRAGSLLRISPLRLPPLLDRPLGLSSLQLVTARQEAAGRHARRCGRAARACSISASVAATSRIVHMRLADDADKLGNWVVVRRRFAPLARSCHDAVSIPLQRSVPSRVACVAI